MSTLFTYHCLIEKKQWKESTHFCFTKSTAIVVILLSGDVLNIVVVVKLLVIFTGQEDGGGLGRLVMVPIANQNENVKLHNMPMVAPWNMTRMRMLNYITCQWKRPDISHVFVYSSLVSTKYNLLSSHIFIGLILLTTSTTFHITRW